MKNGENEDVNEQEDDAQQEEQQAHGVLVLLQDQDQGHSGTN